MDDVTVPDGHTAMQGASNDGRRAGIFGWLRACLSGILELFSFASSPASKQVAFTIAFVGLAAKMAKADGVAVG
ncbi:MAG: hypothetical protein AAFO75_03570, partial [Pseudomonadota bacterium]